jgi:subtilisin family serine protease
MSGTTTATVAVLGLFVLVLAGGASGAVIEPESVDLQDPSNVAVSDGLGSGGGEVELLVELPDHSNASGMGAMQAHATATQTDIRKFGAQTPGVTVEHRFWLTNAVLVRVDTDRVSPTTLARIDGVRSITRNARLRVSQPQAGTETNLTASVGSTYGLTQIGAPEAWEQYDTRGSGTSVAVLDSGIDPDHPDINLTGWAEFSSAGTKVGSNPKDFDPNGHGTHVSGTVAGGATSGESIGVAPATDLYHGAVLTDCDSQDCIGSFAQIIGGMEWAVAQDVDVLSMSLGGAGYKRGLIEPVRNAERAGTTVVVATGNRGAGTSGSPGNIPDAIAVGAVNDNRDVASFSGGERIDTSSAWGQSARADWPDTYVVPTVTAPGAGVRSSLPGGGYGQKWGTSMATPHVAGAAALVQAATASQLSPDEIEAALATTATKPADAPEPAGTRDTRYGAGIIDIPAAIDSVGDEPTTTGFTVSPRNPKPGETVVLSAEGTGESYAWDLDADGTVETTGKTVTTTFGTPGEYEVTLTVTGATGTTERTTGTVAVVEPLSAAFTLSPSAPETGTTLTFDAGPTAGSVDTYEWDFTGDGQVDATGRTATFSYWLAGNYNVTLTVTRGSQTDTVTRTLDVAPKLTAGFSLDPAKPEPGEAVTLDAGSSTGHPDSYEWTVNGATTTGEQVTTAFDTAGQYEVTLTVTRGTQTDTTTRTVTVTDLSAAFTTATDGKTLTLDATPTRGIVDTYEWDLIGDSAPDTTGETTTFTFWRTGTYDVTLRATAPDGRTDTATRTVTVGSTLPPVVGTTPPADPDGDGLYGDVRGDGGVTVLDVQALFNNLDSPAVQTNADAFAFAGVDTSQVSVLDVQALFNDLAQA